MHAGTHSRATHPQGGAHMCADMRPTSPEVSWRYLHHQAVLPLEALSLASVTPSSGLSSTRVIPAQSPSFDNLWDGGRGGRPCSPCSFCSP